MDKIYIKLIAIILLLSFITYIQFPYIKEGIDYFINKEDEIIVTITMNGKKIEKELDEYLLGVVSGEMPANFEEEALKAQVVASRTFVLSRNLKVDNTTNTQVYLTDKQMKEKWDSKYEEYKSKIEKAIEDTHNEVMMYEGEYISALFFASCNGKTNNCEDYFSGGKPYLKSVESKWDLTVDKNNTREVTFTKSELCKIFDISSPELKILSYTDSGYVKEMIVNNKSYTGREIREKLSLASSSFKIIYDNNNYTFITSGYGHGVGMSQYGAQGMALENKSYKDILNHYYQNIEIKSI